LTASFGLEGGAQSSFLFIQKDENVEP